MNCDASAHPGTMLPCEINKTSLTSTEGYFYSAVKEGMKENFGSKL